MADLDFDAVDVDIDQIQLDIDLDTGEAGVLTSYQQKKYLHSQLSNLIIISLAYCSSVAFRNAIFESFELLYNRDDSRGWELSLSMFLFAILSTILGIIITFLISKKESEDEVESYVESEKNKFSIERARREVFIEETEKHEIDERDRAKSMEVVRQKIDVMFEEIIDISLKLESIADETMETLRGKFSGFIEHCFAFATAYGWKEAIYTLFLTIYDSAWLVVLSLWVYAVAMSFAAVLLTILVFRKMGVSHRSLLHRLRGLESQNNKKLDRIATTIFDNQNTLSLISPNEKSDATDNDNEITTKSIIDMFNKDVFLLKTFEFLEITLSVLSAWAFRDSITTTIDLFATEGSQLAGLWIYCGVILFLGAIVTYYFAHRMHSIRLQISNLQNEQCKCKKKHNVLRRKATMLALAQSKYQNSTTLSEADKSAKITRLGTTMLSMEKRENANNQELVESETKEYQLKLKEKMIQLLLSGVAFNCGLAVYDATYETFTRTTENETIRNQIVRGFVALLIFSLLVTVVAIVVILYLDSSLRAVSKVFKMPWKYVQKRGFDVTVNEILKTKSTYDANEAGAGAGGAEDVDQITKQLTSDGTDSSGEPGVQEKAEVISMITIFAKFFVNVVSLCVALAYCASFQELFETIYSAQGSVLSLWVFAVGVIIVSVLLTVAVTKCITAQDINKTEESKSEINATEMIEHQATDMIDLSGQVTERVPTMPPVVEIVPSKSPKATEEEQEAGDEEA